ncbi:hypothetical protein DW785_01015 [Bacteroides xylanisolvens]|nr:hypothetical protein DW785_01015 [Bacteroides xylanisolvens]
MGNVGGIPFLKKNKDGRIDFHKPYPSLCFFWRILHTRVKKGFIIYKSYLFKNSLSTNEIRGIAFRKELLSYLLNRYSYCRNITC